MTLSSNALKWWKESSSYLVAASAGTLALYTLLFTLVNRYVPLPYMDEVFHVDQTMQYCASNWLAWNPKLTTFPGLYFSAAVFLQHLLRLPCSLVLIRGFNTILGGSAFLLLAYIHLVRWHPLASFPKITMRWLCLAFHPSLFFFHFLFYTETFSTASVLLLLVTVPTPQAIHDATFRYSWSYLLLNFILASVCILMRQTNVVFVAAVAGYHGALFLSAYKTFEQRRGTKNSVLAVIRLISWILSPYGLACLGFVIFVFGFNSSQITLGHQEFHQISKHWAQVVYLGLFLFYATSIVYTLSYFVKTYRRSLATFFVFTVITSLLAYFLMINGFIVHPFLLADNRHFIFYVYRRLLSHSWIRNYVLSFLFGIGSAAWLICMRTYVTKHGKLFSCAIVLFILSSFAVLIPSPLIEVRYFHIPTTLWLLTIPVTENNSVALRSESPKRIVFKLNSDFLSLLLYGCIDIVVVYLFLCCSFPYVNYENRTVEVGRFMF